VNRAPNNQKAAARFFVRIAQRGRTQDRLRDDYSLPLFPLVLILEADGTLADDARHLIPGPA
jgi:hypothetical protein